MTYTIRFNRTGKYFLITTAGAFTIDSFLQLADELLQQTEWQANSHCIFDYRESDFLATSIADLQLASQKHAAENTSIGAGKSALVMTDQNNYGMGRMYQGMTEHSVSTQFKIFTNIDEAVEWITDQDS